MKKLVLPTSLFCLVTIFFAASSFSFKAKGHKLTTSPIVSDTAEATLNAEAAESATAVCSKLYEDLHLESLGLSKDVLEFAYKGQQKLNERGLVNNEELIAVCDFSQPSSKKRLYIFDTRNGRVVYNTYVAHGKNSGLVYAERFSNTPESL